MYGHSMEHCWKIHGHSANYIPNTWKKEGPKKAGKTQGYPRNEGVVGEPKLTQEQDNKLMCLLSTQTNQTEEKDHYIAAFAHYEGMQCLNISRTSKWIFDTKASTT